MTSARPSSFPLTELIADLSIRNKPLPEIRQNYRDGKYRPATDQHIVGYIEMARGKHNGKSKTQKASAQRTDETYLQWQSL